MNPMHDQVHLTYGSIEADVDKGIGDVVRIVRGRE